LTGWGLDGVAQLVWARAATDDSVDSPMGRGTDRYTADVHGFNAGPSATPVGRSLARLRELVGFCHRGASVERAWKPIAESDGGPVR